MARQGVVVIGSMNYDSFYRLPREMRMGENLIAASYQNACGGKGANQAVQCAKLGVATKMLGLLGRDMQGDHIEKTMRGYHVDMAWVSRAEVPTGNAAVFVYPNGAVQAAIYGGANMCVSCRQIDAVVPTLRETSIVIFQNEIPMETTEYGIRKGKECGCTVLYNAAPAMPVSDETLRRVDLLVVNESEASFYSGCEIFDESSARIAGKRMIEKLNGNLIITLGALGSLLVTKDVETMIPALRAKAVETTGAGDSYVGTLAEGLLAGLSILEAAKRATAAATITVSAVGAQPSMPTRRELDEMCKGAIAK